MQTCHQTLELCFICVHYSGASSATAVSLVASFRNELDVAFRAHVEATASGHSKANQKRLFQSAERMIQDMSGWCPPVISWSLSPMNTRTISKINQI